MVLSAAGSVRAGVVVGWGWSAVNSRELSGNNFAAIAAGGFHSLALQVCAYNLAGDLNKDCRVDFVDLGMMGEDWLRSISLADIYPSRYGDCVVDFADFTLPC